MAEWLWRRFQVPVGKTAWVQVPPLSSTFLEHKSCNLPFRIDMRLNFFSEIFLHEGGGGGGVRAGQYNLML